ncbi:RHS repeat-associated core domain-containing protein [Endozoicomonas acroporae]|nr:RHS repeat-associated core domain-containing protein [Endozoicomonas acroporae]
MDEVGLIHMNGRVYDAKLGRFRQADPFIQAVGNTQSFNRYSYVL